MLNLFRQGGLIKSLMGGVVVVLIAAFMFDYRSKGAELKKECVATIERDCIEPKDYNVLLRLVGPSGASNKELKKTGFLQHTVNALVERELLLREAKRIGMSVSEEAVDDELALGRVHYSWPVDAPVPRALMQGMPYPRMGATDGVTYIRVRNSKTEAFDYQLYRRQLQQLLRMSPKEFKELQTEEITAERMRQLVTSSVRVSPEEAYFIFEQQKSTVTARFVETKGEWFARFASDNSDNAGQQYLAANSADVDAAWTAVKDKWTDGCPVVSEIAFHYSIGADADARAATAERAAQARQLLKEGVAFEAVARAFSDGDQAALGGAVGCLSDAYGPVHEDLAKAAAELKPGQVVSSAVETPKGLHILRLDAKLTAADAEKAGKLYVARGLAAEKAGREAAIAFGKKLIAAAESGKGLKEAMDELATAAVTLDDKAKPDAAEKLVGAALASDLAPRFDISRATARGGSPVSGVSDSALVGKLLALNDDAVLPDVLTTYGGAAVVQVKEKDLATREAFDKDKDKILESLVDQKRAEVLSAYIEKLRTSVKKLVIDQKYAGTGPDLPSTDDPSDG